MARHNDLGKNGEDLACNYLAEKNYEIVARNLICRGIEIDIVAYLPECIVFVEVKTRSSKRWGNPEEAVSNSKMVRMMEAADHYLIENDIDREARFDIVAVVIGDNATEINHIEDAFLPSIN